MKTVTLYSTDWCPYCKAAKSFLAQKGVPYEEIDLTDDDAGREALVARANGRRTVPQMFVGEVHIGGYDDLRALDAKGGFMPLVTA
ncbi:MAG: glutaredoxin 3 [Deltaproteobacteria bacterium]|nr:glutaredoxin 3 [Deltaproteobacteria bacterium]